MTVSERFMRHHYGPSGYVDPKLTRIETEVLRVVRAEGGELRSYDVYARLKPLAFSGLHLILDNLVKMGLIGSRREDGRRVVWSVKP